jgi:hypothetical protein
MAKDEEKDWREEAGERYKEKIKGGRFKLEVGDNTLRILPRVKSKSKVPFYEYLVHREVGPNKRFLRCGKNMHGDGECWLCDSKIPALAKSESESKQRMAAALQPKEQFVVQVALIDADSGKMKGPFLWTVPTGGARSLSARLLGVLKNTKRDYIDLKKGYNLTIERTGTGKNDTIYGQPIPDEESSKVPDSLMLKAKPFSELVPPYSEEQQKSAYFGQDADAEDDQPKKKRREEEEEPETEEVEEEEDEKPKKKKRVDEDEEEEPEEDEAPKKKKKVADEDEEELEEEVEDEDEDEKPKKKKKPVDEDEEEEPSEDEEEEEKPKKKKKPVDEDEEEEPAEEEEDEAPKKKKKKVVDEDEEETEEEVEDDEDEAPKKKKKHSEDEDEEEEHPKKKKKHTEDDED